MGVFMWIIIALLSLCFLLIFIFIIGYMVMSTDTKSIDPIREELPAEISSDF